MADLQIWKIVADMLLIMSLIYLSYRIAKGTTEPLERKARALEASLKMLLDEADQASKQLNDKLGKRQSELQKSLLDLKTLEERLDGSLTKSESVELRLQEYIKSAEDQARLNSKLEKKIENLIAELDERDKHQRQATQSSTSRLSAEEGKTFVQSARTQSNKPFTRTAEETTEINFEAQSNYDSQSLTQQAATVNRAQQRYYTNNRDRAENIYGESIHTQSEQYLKAPIPEEQRLDYSPVKPRVNKSQQSNKYQETQEIQEIYDAAERMLRAGLEVNKVANNTNLSLDEVQLLSQMITRESAIRHETQTIESNISDADPRLGVLAGMRRQAVQL